MSKSKETEIILKNKNESQNKSKKEEINDIQIKSDTLHTIILYLKNNLTQENLQELSNKCNSINKYCKGDGGGLLGGCLIDILICKFFETKLDKYQEFRSGEADMKLCEIQLSQKKINGKSTLALDWSKNKNDSIKEYFNYHILIINLKTEKWWKNKPTNILEDDPIIYNDIIKACIYLIYKDFCKKNIKLSNNNKTNTLIDSKSLYKMMKISINHELYIEIPLPNKNIDFNILNAFSE